MGGGIRRRHPSHGLPGVDPPFFLAYFAAARSWKLAIASAVVMGLVTKLLFEVALGIPLPGGILF
jgi:hypothetical protein